QGKAVEIQLARATPVGRHHRVFADAHAGVHHLVLDTGWGGAGRGWFGIVLETHQHLHFGAERLAVEFNRLFTAPVEDQIQLHHGIGFGCTHNFSFLVSQVGRRGNAALPILFADASSNYAVASASCASGTASPESGHRAMTGRTSTLAPYG